MNQDETNPAYVHPTDDGAEPSEPSGEERRVEESVTDRMWRFLEDMRTVMVIWFDRDKKSFSFVFTLGRWMNRLEISGGQITVRVLRGREPAVVPMIEPMVRAEGKSLFVPVRFSDKLVGLFSGTPLENLTVVIERKQGETRRKVKCRVVTAGHAKSF